MVEGSRYRWLGEHNQGLLTTADPSGRPRRTVQIDGRDGAARILSHSSYAQATQDATQTAVNAANRADQVTSWVELVRAGIQGLLPGARSRSEENKITASRQPPIAAVGDFLAGGDERAGLHSNPAARDVSRSASTSARPPVSVFVARDVHAATDVDDAV